jgi:hypothetical protein
LGYGGVMKSIFILLLCLGLCGCASMFPDIRVTQAENQGRIYTGMSFEQVKQIVGREPECIATDICRNEHDTNGNYFIWILNGRSGSLNLARTYTFRFKDNKLESWGNN